MKKHTLEVLTYVTLYLLYYIVLYYIFRYSEALGKLEGELEDCREQLSIWQEKGDIADGNMTEARKQLKAMAMKQEEEGYVMMRRMKVAEDRSRELQVMLLQVIVYIMSNIV